ncbi:MAG: hypothetical protein HOV80_16645 [Polyangiaceae bacterium]|nr:hypothetical protein [Polyangiaceae bacterium]
MRALSRCTAALVASVMACTDPSTLEGPTPTASAASSARAAPSGTGVLKVDMDYRRPPLPTSDDRGCTESLPSIDPRRVLSKEAGVSNPSDGPFAGSAGFFLVQQPERIPEPGATSIPGLFLVIERGTRDEPGRVVSLRARWENRVDKTRVVMRPVEGSIEDWRAPSWHVIARDPVTQRVYRFDPRYHRSCGNVSSVTPDHYITLDAGAHTPAGMEWSLAEWELPKGKIEVWLSYRFCGHAEPGIGIGDQYVTDGDVLREDVTKGTVASNAITIDMK